MLSRIVAMFLLFVFVTNNAMQCYNVMRQYSIELTETTDKSDTEKEEQDSKETSEKEEKELDKFEHPLYTPFVHLLKCSIESPHSAIKSHHYSDNFLNFSPELETPPPENNTMVL